jgi:hypothetical protein
MAEYHTKDTKGHQGRREAYAVAIVNRCGRRVKSTPEDREKRQKQTQDNADNDAGDNGKIKRGVFALDPNVAGQAAQPFWRETAPHHQSYQCGDHADDYDQLSEFPHLSKSCANQSEAQASE